MYRNVNSSDKKQNEAPEGAIRGAAGRGRSNQSFEKRLGRASNWKEVVQEQSAEPIPALVSDEEKVTLPFGMDKTLAAYVESAYPGIVFVSKRGAPYSHPKSFIDRLMALRYLLCEVREELDDIDGLPVVGEFLGNKFCQKNFTTDAIVLSFGGVKSQYRDLSEAKIASFKSTLDYIITFNFYDFVPTDVTSWRKISELCRNTNNDVVFAAFVPTSYVIEGSATHELTGKHVSPSEVSVKVANDAYIDTDNGWLQTSGSTEIDGRHLHWEVMGVKFGVFRIARFTHVSRADVKVKKELHFDTLLDWKQNNTLSGSVLGVPLQLAKHVELRSGVMHFHKTQFGAYVPVKLSLLNKLMLHAIKMPDLRLESARMTLERVATGLSAEPVEAAIAVAVARLSAARVSIQSSLMSNTKESQEIMKTAYNARNNVVKVHPCRVAAAYCNQILLVMAICALRYFPLFLAIAALIPLVLLLRGGEAWLWFPVVGCFAYVAVFEVYPQISPWLEQPGTDFYYSNMRNGDYILANRPSRTLISHKIIPTTPLNPESNEMFVSAYPVVDLVSQKSPLCIHFGIECEAKVNTHLLEGAKILTVSDEKFRKETAPVSAFVGISVATTPHVIANTTHNESIVLHNRAFANKGVIDEEEMLKFELWVEEHFLNIFNITEEFNVVADVGAWFSSLDPSKAKLYSSYDNVSNLTINKKSFVRDAFLKIEHVMKDHYSKPGRLVQGADPSMNLTMGPWVAQFSKLLHILWHDRYRVFFNGSVNAEQEGERFDYYTSMGYTWADGDFSSFDSTQSRGIFKVLHRVYERFGCPAEVLAVMRAQVHKVGFTRCGLRYEVDGTRASGDPDTLVGNGIVNYLVNLYAWSKQHPEISLNNTHPFTPDELDLCLFNYTSRTTYGEDVYCDRDDLGAYARVIVSVRDSLVAANIPHLHDLFEYVGKFVDYDNFPIQVEVCGDDNLTAYQPCLGVSDTPSIIALLGMCNNVNHQLFPEICSSLFWPTIVDGREVSVLSAKPGRLAVKLGYINRPMGKQLLSELCSKIYGTLMDCHHVPFLSQLLKKYLELIPAGVESKPLYHKYKAHAERYHPITEAGISMFCDRYSFTRAEYEELVGSLELITSLPWTHRHVLFDRLYEKDNDYEF